MYEWILNILHIYGFTGNYSIRTNRTPWHSIKLFLMSNVAIENIHVLCCSIWVFHFERRLQTFRLKMSIFWNAFNNVTTNHMWSLKADIDRNTYAHTAHTHINVMKNVVFCASKYGAVLILSFNLFLCIVRVGKTIIKNIKKKKKMT